MVFRSSIGSLRARGEVWGNAADYLYRAGANAFGRSALRPRFVGTEILHASLAVKDQRMVREAILVPMLRESMVIWIKIAGDKVEEKAARDAEYGPMYEQVDRLIGMMFAPPVPPEGGEPAPAADEQMAGV